MEIFAVRIPGPMTTVQGLGRLAFLDRGVPLSGALDPLACRVANLLAGNPEEAAVLEITESRVSQLHASALFKLSMKLKVAYDK